MDFLGLDNLKTITNILQHPIDGKDDWNLQDPELRDKMLDDKDIYKKVFATGLTNGIFQFESPGMKKMLKQFQPESMDDIILLVAAYRPGPMSYIPEIIDWKWYNKAVKAGQSEWKRIDRDTGKPELVSVSQAPTSSITLKNEDLQKILAPTYGCPIYQEQIMQIFQVMAGYSLGGADIVRRAMSKKHLDEIEMERHAFIYGDEARGIPGTIKKQGITEHEANELFDQMMPFAEYGFNKSHATAYALVSVFTAYQKLYHTLDFYKETLNADRTGYKDYPGLFEDMRDFGINGTTDRIKLLPLDMMKSTSDFSIDLKEGGIRFGFGSVKECPSIGDLYRTTNVQEFIRMNPSVTEKTVDKFASFGLFDSCWESKGNHQEYEKQRVNGNRHEVRRWIAENFTLLRKYYKQRDKIESIKTTLMGEEGLTAKDREKLAKSEEKERASLNEIMDEIRSHYNNDWKETIESRTNEVVPVRESGAEVIENRTFETKCMMTTFAISESLSKIKDAVNKESFNTLEKKDAWIPSVILSVSEKKQTKKSRKDFYDVQLMDYTGNVITRRFDAPVQFAEMEIKLPAEEHKFFNVRVNGDEWHESDIRPVKCRHSGNIRRNIVRNTEERVSAIANGGQCSSERINGKPVRTVNMDMGEER